MSDQQRSEPYQFDRDAKIIFAAREQKLRDLEQHNKELTTKITALRESLEAGNEQIRSLEAERLLLAKQLDAYRDNPRVAENLLKERLRTMLGSLVIARASTVLLLSDVPDSDFRDRWEAVEHADARLSDEIDLLLSAARLLLSGELFVQLETELAELVVTRQRAVPVRETISLERRDADTGMVFEPDLGAVEELKHALSGMTPARP